MSRSRSCCAFRRPRVRRHRVRVRGIVGYQQLGNCPVSSESGQGTSRTDSANYAPRDRRSRRCAGLPRHGGLGADARRRRISSPGPRESPATRSTLNLNDALGAIRRRGRDHRCEAAEPASAARWPPADAATAATCFSMRLCRPVPPPSALLSIPLNSEVRVTGICLVRSGGLWHIPQSFRMLLRSPQDVVVLALRRGGICGTFSGCWGLPEEFFWP